MDIAAAIEKIVTLTTKSLKTEILKAPEREGVYFLIAPDGKAQKVIADPAWHHEHLDTPIDLREFIQSAQTKDGVVFYHDDKIIFVYDLKDRRDVAICNLRLSPQFLWLRDESKHAMNQQGLIRTLRIMFRGCNESNLLSLVRNLKFNSAGEAAGQIQQGRESMSKQIIAEVRGTDAIPEELTLMIPIFENHQFSAQVLCAVEVMTQEQMFKLTPIPMSLRRAHDGALADIKTYLKKQDVPIFRGSPK